MAIEKNPLGSAVVEAVKNQMKFEAGRFRRSQNEVKRLMEQTDAVRDELVAARERWEQCKDWLDKYMPGWERTLVGDDLQWYHLNAIVKVKVAP